MERKCGWLRAACGVVSNALEHPWLCEFHKTDLFNHPLPVYSSRFACCSHFGHVTIEMASGGGDRLKSYKPLFKDIAVTRREREEEGVVLRRRKRNEEVGACSFRLASVHFNSLTWLMQAHCPGCLP